MSSMLAVFHIYVLFVLALVFGASCAVFWQLERRWTARRQWVSLKEWGRAHRFRLRTPEEVGSIAILSALPDAHVRAALADATTTILQIETESQAQWNLLVRRGSSSSWPDTALRPTNQSSSFIDLLSMQSFPLLGSTERFVIYGVDSAAARR